MQLKVIGRDVCLQAKTPFGLLNDLRPKRCLNILKREESKEIKNSMKVEDGSMHCKKYNGYCTKQRIIIPKAT
jgi:hypothetical protein